MASFLDLDEAQLQSLVAAEIAAAVKKEQDRILAAIWDAAIPGDDDAWTIQDVKAVELRVNGSWRTEGCLACGNQVRAKQLCTRHYYQAYRYGLGAGSTDKGRRANLVDGKTIQAYLERKGK